MKDFARTLRTADDADGIAKLLEKVSGDGRRWLPTFTESQRLRELAQRYRDYAAALRASVVDEDAEPAPDQAVLL